MDSIVDKRTISQCLALVFAVLLITSLGAPIGAAGAGPDDGNGETPAAGPFDDPVTQVDGTDDRADREDDEPVAVDEAVHAADGTTEVVVRLEELELSTATTTEEAVESRKAQAAQSQEPFVEFVQATDGVELRNRFWLVNAVLVEVDTDQVDVADLTAQDGVTELHANFEVESPEPIDESDEPIDESDVAATDDSSAAEYETTYGLDQVNATDVWDEHETKGAGTTVAVLDTGVDVTHPDIELYTDDPDDPTYPGGWAEFDDAGDQVPDSEPHDSAYHGTHVSGTVVGGDDSGEHIGVAPEADLMHGMVLDGGSGSFAQIIGGMEWAVNEDADVVSMSLGAAGYMDQMIDPVRNAEDAGVLVIAAAGNDGLGTTGSPGNVYESFAIGAADDEANIAYFSGGETVDTAEAWGSAAPAEWPDEYVVPDVSGPGVAVKSTYPVDHEDGPYHEISGTSMATPHVSGVAALMLSAAGDDVPPADVRQIVEETAWKPGGESAGQDTRYGYGIVDAKAATDQIAANSGIEGTVEDGDGTAITDAVVEFDDAPQWTAVDENGDYMIRAMPGDYTVTADAFGYEAASEPVTITEDSFLQQDFALEDALDVRVLEDQPEGIEAGSTLETTVDVANVERVTVDLAGNYSAADATLTVDGQQATFGEPVTFDDPQSGELTVAVETAADVDGTVALEHAFEGLGGTATATTGSTTVFDEAIPIAVVDNESGVYSQGVVDALDEQLPPWYETERVTPAAAADSLTSYFEDPYDVYVVQNATDDQGSAATIVEETKAADIGVVYLDQFGLESSGISDLSDETGDPETVVDAYGDTSNPIQYAVNAEHPIFDGVAAEGDTVDLYDPDPFWGFASFHTYFDGYDGDYDPAVVADVQIDTWSASPSPGLAVDDVTRTVLAASLGHTSFANGNDYEDDADAILANAVEYVVADSPVEPITDQDVHVEPGESIDVTVSAEQLEKVKVDVNEESTIGEDDLTLYVDGTINAFGEWRAYESPRDGEYEIEVAVDEDAVGTVSLDHTFRTATGDDGDSEETTVTTGPTSVYEPPLHVSDDVDTIQEAADIVVEDGDIVVDDGVYDEKVALDTDGVTIRAAENASPTIQLPDDHDWTGPFYVAHLSGDDVTLDGIEVTAANPDVFFSGSTVYVSGDDATVTNATVTEGDVGIELGHPDEFGVQPADVTIRDVTLEGATNLEPAGAVHGEAPGVTVANVTVEDSTMGVSLADSPNTTVRDSTFTDLEESGVLYEYSIEESGTIENNTVESADTGITLAYDNEADVGNNTVSDVATGFDLGSGGNPDLLATNVVEDADTGFALDTALNGGGTLVENDVEADLGVHMTGSAPEQIEFAYNDLSATDDAVVSTSDEPFDVRQNYYGDDGPVPSTFDGDAVYDPYLTDHPDEIAAEPAETTAIESQLLVEGNTTSAVGIPGPTELTVNDLVRTDFEGAMYGFDAEEQQWTHLTGGHTVGALDAVVVVAESDGVLTLNFQSDDPRAPSQQTLVEGWNFVTVPEHGPVNEAFDAGSAEPTVAMGLHDQPDGQLGPAGELEGIHQLSDADDAPTATPFEGYFVFAEEEGTVPAYLPADPTMDELYGALGYDDPVPEPTAIENVTIDEALERTEGANVTAEVLRSVVRAELEAAVAESDLETRAALDGAAADVIAQVPASHEDHDLVVEVTEAVVEELLQDRFDATPIEPDADDERRTERIAPANGAAPAGA